MINFFFTTIDWGITDDTSKIEKIHRKEIEGGNLFHGNVYSLKAIEYLKETFVKFHVAV